MNSFEYIVIIAGLAIALGFTVWTLFKERKKKEIDDFYFVATGDMFVILEKQK